MKDAFDDALVYDFSYETKVNKNDLLNHCIENVDYIINELLCVSKNNNNNVLENKIDEMKCISYCFNEEEWDDIEEELLEDY